MDIMLAREDGEGVGGGLWEFPAGLALHIYYLPACNIMYSDTQTHTYSHVGKSVRTSNTYLHYLTEVVERQSVRGWLHGLHYCMACT
jgi:hypothetical protein